MKFFLFTLIVFTQSAHANYNSLTYSFGQERSQIEESKLENYDSMIDVLREQAGIEVFNQGGQGKVSSTFIRGANSEHTLVLIDGIVANDPLSPTRAFDFARINLEDVESIEIIRGPGSVLYGADALGGVINIVTKKGRGKKSAYVEVEGGSFDSQRFTLGTSGKSRSTHYNLSISQESTEGFSSANSLDGNAENDGHEQTSASLRMGNRFRNGTKVEVIGKYIDAKTDLDAFGGPGGDNTEFRDETQQVFARIQTNTPSMRRRLDTQFAVNYQLTDRKTFDNPFTGDDFFKGQQLKAEMVNTYQINNFHKSKVGIEYSEELGDSEDITNQKAINRAAIWQHQYQKNNFKLTSGVRGDRHSESEDAVTYSIAPELKIARTTLRAGFGSGFKAPSLFQLFDPNFGNPDLEAEKVERWEVGFDQSLFSNDTVVSLTYFENDFSNLVSFDPNTFQSVNLGASTIHGLESKFQTQLAKKVNLTLNHTHLFEFENGGDKLIRRPRNSWNATIDFRPTNSLLLSTNFRHLGERQDFDATTFSRIIAPSHEVVNFLAQFEWQKGQSIYMKINNLLDKPYEEIDGFGTARFSVFAGGRLTL